MAELDDPAVAVLTGEPEVAVEGSFRPYEPSPRERDQGVVVRAAHQTGAEAPTAQAAPGAEPAAVSRPTLGERMRTNLRELNPWIVCRGYPVTPALAFAGLQLVQGTTILAFYLFVPDSISLAGGANPATVALIGSLLGTGAGAVNSVGGFGLGYLADRGLVRRTTLLRIGIWICRIGALLMGFAGTPLAYSGFFILSVVGLGITNPANAILADVYPVDVRLRLAYFQGKMGQAGQVLALPLAGLFATLLGWQWSLVILGAIGLLPALLAVRVREPRRGAGDLASGASPDPGLPVVAEDDHNAAAPHRVGFFEALRTLYHIRSLRLLYLAFVVTGSGAGAILAYSFLFFSTRFHISAAERGLLLGALPALAGFFVLALQGELQARLAAYRPGRLLIVAAIALAAIVPIDLLLVASHNLAVAVVLFCLLSALYQMTPLTMQAVLLVVLPARVRSLGLEAPLLISVLFQIPATLVFRFGLPVVAGVLASIDVGFADGAIIALPIPWLVVAVLLLLRASRYVDGDIRTMVATAAADAQPEGETLARRRTILVCRDLDVHYGPVQVVRGFDLDVEEGSIVALLGTNGAGKSTILRAIAGVQPATTGVVFFDGEDITHLPPHRAAARGVVMVPGGRAVFPTLTVAENLRVAAQLYRKDAAYVRERTEVVYGYFPILRTRAQQVAGNLSGGEQQMLALGQAFLMRPRLLMIDELSLGLAPQVVETLLDIVRRIGEQGTTVLLVEQSLNVALAIATRAIFLERGQTRYDGPVGDLISRSEVVRSIFLGESRRASSVSGTDRAGAATPVDADPVLQAHGIRIAYGGVRALDGVDLSLWPGEVVGIIGANGAGKTTLFDVISGFARPDAGRVLLGKLDVTRATPDVRARLGLSRSFQNVTLFPALTVRDNILVAMERSLESRSTVAAMLGLPQYRSAERRARRRVDALVETLGLERFANKFLRELSTGSRRIVDIACILASNPTALLLDEPSSGLAQAEVEELEPVMRRIVRETGTGILLIEHDMTLVQAASDRIVCMHLGEVLCSGSPSDVLSDPAVVGALLGERGAGARSGGGR